ncbi:hypothetical protein KTN05_03475 [Paracoccus sp. Z118]|uniref:glycosyltransferase n=1 Tax=Paracoccus sp. Z118 TaxID=2851017 RepID=UPI001C2C2BEE|nr:glycosyltransferase [Paracoccus sp. Z118]MBV0890907.1 hypothetical protein [Paracoccus sp. Z118]
MRAGPEIVVFADPRYPGGTTRAFCAEARALHKVGAQVGFCPVLGSELGRAAQLPPAIAELVDAGTLSLVDARQAARTRLAIVHHPAIFRHLPAEALGLRPDRVVLVLHHPPLDGFGRPAYDLEGCAANLRDVFGADMTLAPVGPVVRDQLRRMGWPEGGVLAEDWTNLIDFDEWPRRALRQRHGRITIGRHSRPSPLKFPDDLAQALLAYPEAPDVSVRMLGAPDDLARRYGRKPANWELLAFDAEPVPRFLETLDYYVYVHGEEWVEAFGYGILEAIAVGVPVILPPVFRATFGTAALYAEPSNMQDLIRGMEADPATRDAHVAQARAEAEARFSADLFLPRLERLVPGWRGAPFRAARPLPPLRSVMVTSNGVGLGHLTRLMALARNLPAGSETAFFTLSRGYRLAVEAGHLTQYVPFHASTGADIGAWNRALTEELGDFLDLVGPDLVVFDGNLPYDGLVSALDQRRGLPRAWVRRAMWGVELPAVRQRAPLFDLVIEPGELAHRIDRVGREVRAGAVTVAPIVATPPDRRMTRDEARAALGLQDASTAVGLMLGSAGNFDITGIRRAILDHLLRLPDVELVEITATDSPAPPEGPRRLTLYPAARYSAAFDLMVTAAGYNSFHEAMLHRVPTIFVPNEAPEMDLQIQRARFARSTGCGELLRASDAILAPRVIDRMLDPATREAMRGRMARLEMGDGAAEAARLLGYLGRMLRLRDPL